MVAVDDGGIVLTEEDWVKHFLPCRPENKRLLKATDETTIGVLTYSQPTETSQAFAFALPFPFTQV